MSQVRLNWRELAIAADVGVTRRIRSLANGQHDRFEDGDRWMREIEGAAAEEAVAKLHGLYWGGHTEAFGEPDVGFLQVRWTARPSGCLVAHPEDADDTVLVLVTGVAPVFHVRGYLPIAAAKHERWWRDDVPYPAFFVPQSELLGAVPA